MNRRQIKAYAAGRGLMEYRGRLFEAGGWEMDDDAYLIITNLRFGDYSKRFLSKEPEMLSKDFKYKRRRKDDPRNNEQ